MAKRSVLLFPNRLGNYYRFLNITVKKFIACLSNADVSFPTANFYVLIMRWNRLKETIPTNGHNIGIGFDQKKYFPNMKSVQILSSLVLSYVDWFIPEFSWKI